MKDLLLTAVFVSIVAAAGYSTGKYISGQLNTEIDGDYNQETKSLNTGEHCGNAYGHPDFATRLLKYSMENPDSFEVISSDVYPANSYGMNRFIIKFRSQNHSGVVSVGSRTGYYDSTTCLVLEWE